MIRHLLFENIAATRFLIWFLLIFVRKKEKKKRKGGGREIFIVTWKFVHAKTALKTLFVRASYEQLRFASKWHGLTPGVSLRSPASFGDNCNNCHGLHCSSWRRAEYFEERRRPSSLHGGTSGRLILGWLFHSESCSIHHLSPLPTRFLCTPEHTRTPGSCASRRPPTTPTKPPLKQLVSHESWHIYPSIRPFVHPSVCPSVHLFIHPSIHLFIHLLVAASSRTVVRVQQNTKATARDKRQRQEDTGVCARAYGS